MQKTKPVYVCDWCGNEISGDRIATQDVPNEGSSSIFHSGTYASYDVGGQDYCSIDCLMSDIRKSLEKKDKE